MEEASLAYTECLHRLGHLVLFQIRYFFADVINQMLGTEIEVSNVAAKWLNELTASSYFGVDKIILPVGIST